MAYILVFKESIIWIKWPIPNSGTSNDHKLDTNNDKLYITQILPNDCVGIP